MPNDTQSQPKRLWLRVLLTIVGCAFVLGASGAAIFVINQTQPKAQRVEATRKSAAIVETLTVERATYAPMIVVLGAVEPANEVILGPRVNGQVTEVSPKFVPGGMIREGDLLLRIDPADFDNAVSSAKSELDQVLASLEIEQGRQSLAEKELALLGESIDEANRALVLRKPQIESIQAQISAAESAIEEAQLDLARTSIKAPFDAQILSRLVNVGSQVAQGDELAELVGIEEYWIMASVPIRSLYWLEFPEQGGQGSPVILRNPDTWPPGAERQAEVTRMIGRLDPQTRLARVLITVQDPLARETDGPPLIIDSLVETHIQCRPIEDVVRLDRQYVRDGDTVWVMADDKLEIRPVEVIFRDADYAYVRSGLDDGDEVVTTTLATVAAGIGLQKQAPAAASENPVGEAAD